MSSSSLDGISSVVSYLVHQCEDDDEFQDLYRTWNLSSSASSPVTRIFVPINDQCGASKRKFGIPGGGNHWSLLLWELVDNCSEVKSDDGGEAAVKRKVERGCRFHHFDSSQGYNSSAALTVARKLYDVLRAGGGIGSEENMCKSKAEGTTELQDPVSVLECRTPQQTNGYDCGIYMLGMAEATSSVSAPSLLGAAKEAYEDAVAVRIGGGEEGSFAPEMRRRIAKEIRRLAGV